MKLWYMFVKWLASKEIARLEGILLDKDHEINSIKYYTNRLETKLKDLQKELDQRDFKEFDDCSVDFKGMNAVSIERAYDKDFNRVVTIVGYKDFKGKCKQGLFFVSTTKHGELVKEFELTVKTKKD